MVFIIGVLIIFLSIWYKRRYLKKAATQSSITHLDAEKKAKIVMFICLVVLILGILLILLDLLYIQSLITLIKDIFQIK